MSDGIPLLDLFDEKLDEVDKVFKHVDKGLSILTRADDLIGELSSTEPCMQGTDTDSDEE